MNDTGKLIFEGQFFALRALKMIASYNVFNYKECLLNCLKAANRMEIFISLSMNAKSYFLSEFVNTSYIE